MEAIRAIGELIEAAWRSQNYDHAVFAELARVTLEEAAPHRSFAIEELIRWLHKADQIPRQTIETTFGEPPVTLFAGRRFFIEALFWLDGTTAIHQHGFSGAFQVMHGESIHTRFSFEPKRMINAHLQFGELRAAPPEWLRRGATREINSGDDLIHSLFHLERPSVTLVVRTHFDSGAPPQYSYLRPGIAVDRFYRDERLPRLLQLFAVAHDCGFPERAQLVAEFLESADLHSAVLLLERLAFVAPDQFDAMLALLRKRDPESAATLAAAFGEVRRQQLVTQWRRQVHAPEHRFLLALLLNVSGRDEILRLVSERVPMRDPIDQVITWLGEMSPPDQAGEARNPLSYHLGGVELRILRHLLARQSVEEIIASLDAEFDDVGSQIDDIRALCAALPRALLLEPLFR